MLLCSAYKPVLHSGHHSISYVIEASVYLLCNDTATCYLDVVFYLLFLLQSVQQTFSYAICPDL